MNQLLNRYFKPNKLLSALIGLFAIHGVAYADTTSSTLKLLQESKIYKLLNGYNKKDEFEASGVVVKGKHFYVVFDNLSQIAKFRHNLPKNSKKNQLLGSKNSEVGFEGITYNPLQQQFYVVIESVENGEHYNAKLHTYNADLALQNSHWLGYNFQSSNKGFEGLLYVHSQNQDFVLGLCEGNDCQAGKASQVTGNGRIKVFKRKSKQSEYAPSIQLPLMVKFVDYAGMDLKNSRLAVVSQESSQMWIGTLDIENWQISGAGKIYQFPRNKKGKVVYCNVEGITWLNETQLVTVTDKMKNKEQPKRCAEKDQSIQIFELPPE